MSYTKSYLRMPCSINGRLAPSQYFITSCDTGTRPCILQRWIESTTYNDKYSKSGSCVTDHNIILRNLVHECETMVFIKNPKEPVQSKPCE